MMSATLADDFCRAISGQTPVMVDDINNALAAVCGKRVNLAGAGLGYVFADGSFAKLGRLPEPAQVPAFLKCSGLAGECGLALGHTCACAS
jgi:hypothetical protein